jgi:choice-of-anchor B domain-containing protein
MLNRTIITIAAFVLGCVAMAQDSLNVRRLFHWEDTSIPIGDATLQNKYNEVWGYAANGREYAFIGSTVGLNVFDVTDPENSVLVDQVAGRFSGPGVIHRDYKVHAHHLYAVCDQGPSSLQIFDLQYLPDSVSLVYDSDEFFLRAHNIQVDTVNARLYTCAGSNQFSVYSIADPAAPVRLADLEQDVPWWGSAVGNVHDCFVRDNIVWCNDEDGMHVLDFTDPQEPVLLGAITSYDNAGYNHSGWMNDAGTLYVMADETHGSPLKFIDATDVTDLEVGSTVTTGVHPLSVVHNAFFTGDTVHVAYYHDGYWSWDLNNPDQPVLLGFFDTSLVPNGNTYKGAWGVYPFLPSGNILVSDMQTGLWVLRTDFDMSVGERPRTPAFRIYPTITQGPVFVDRLDERTRSAHVEVIASNGAVLHQQREMSASRMELDLSSYPEGLFLISITQGGERTVQRVIKRN